MISKLVKGRPRRATHELVLGDANCIAKPRSHTITSSKDWMTHDWRTHRILAQHAAENAVGGVGRGGTDHVCGVDVLELSREADLLEVLLRLKVQEKTSRRCYRLDELGCQTCMRINREGRKEAAALEGLVPPFDPFQYSTDARKKSRKLTYPITSAMWPEIRRAQ